SRPVAGKKQTHATKLGLAILCAGGISATCRADDESASAAALRAAVRRALDQPVAPADEQTISPLEVRTNIFGEVTLPKPFQRTNTATPPLSPEHFNPDAGMRLPPNLIYDAALT